MIGQYRCRGFTNKLEKYSVRISAYNTEDENVHRFRVPRAGVIKIAHYEDKFVVTGFGDIKVAREYPPNATYEEMLKFTIPEISKWVLTADVTLYQKPMF